MEWDDPQLRFLYFKSYFTWSPSYLQLKLETDGIESLPIQSRMDQQIYYCNCSGQLKRKEI